MSDQQKQRLDFRVDKSNEFNPRQRAEKGESERSAILLLAGSTLCSDLLEEIPRPCRLPCGISPFQPPVFAFLVFDKLKNDEPYQTN